MYSVVLATVLTAGGVAPDCHFGVSFGCHGCHGCWGGCSGGCWGSCYGGCWGGCSGGCYGGCWGSCYGGCWGSGYAGNVGTAYPSYWGCSGGCYGSCFGSCYGGCFGGYSTPVIPAVPGGSAEPLTTPPQKTAPGDQKPTGSLESRQKASATVIVKAPANARLLVNGLPMALKGTEQTFATPALEVGRSYAYNFQVDTVQD